MSGFSKVIPIGSAGAMTVSEAGGEAKIQLSLSESVGGGKSAGAVKAVLSAEVDVEARLMIDLGLDLLAAKYPAAASLITGAKAIMDAEIAAN